MRGTRRIAIASSACGLLGLLVLVPAAQANLLFEVNSTGDLPDAAVGDHACDTRPAAPGDQCTLRAVIQETNMEFGADGIDFNIPGPGVKTIAPKSELPDITGQVEINGYTQGAASPNTKPLGQGDDAILLVELSGENAPQTTDGLTLAPGSTGSIVKGLVINRFSTGVVPGADATIEGNFIGTSPGGKVAEGMGFDGISQENGHVEVGGLTPAARNLISGNSRNGIQVVFGELTAQGNFIGTQRDGSSPLPNMGSGIDLFFPDNSIGGLNGGNVIAFNGNDGITMFNNTMDNPVSRNRIFSNGDLGIDLGDNGVTPNDVGDVDTGPNELQNTPAITSATRGSGGAVTVVGRLRSTPNRQFTLEFFANPPHEDEGASFIGQTAVATDGTGLAPFTFHSALSAPVGNKITATATNENHSTSEFSPPRTVFAG